MCHVKHRFAPQKVAKRLLYSSILCYNNLVKILHKEKRNKHGLVFYHIYPLGLTGAPAQNDYGEVVHRLPKLLPWIDHIKEIGCNAIYIGPLFESVGHGYETTDYRTLDRRLGDNDDLKEFVRTCHEKGVRVIFDGVFNHTGRDFFAFKDLQKNRENSQYKDWYCEFWRK